MTSNSNEMPALVDQTMLHQAQVDELNQTLSDALGRSSQYRALATYFEAECRQLQTDLAEARAALEEARGLIDGLRSAEASTP